MSNLLIDCSVLTVDLFRSARRCEDFPRVDDNALRALIDRYIRFLLLCAKYPDRALAPTKDIDLIWHLHMMNPRGYLRDCETIFGDVLDHVDPTAVAAGVINGWDYRNGAFGVRSAILELSIRLTGVALLVLGSRERVIKYLDDLEGTLLALANSREPITHARLAQQVDVSSRQVDRWLAGTQTPTPQRLIVIAKALSSSRHSKTLTRTDTQLEHRVARWFASRSLQRAFVDHFGESNDFMQVPALLRTLLARTIIHEVERESPEMGSDYGPFCLFAFGTGSLSGWLALEVLGSHAHDQIWRDAASKILAPQRAREEEARRTQTGHVAPASQLYPWDMPGFLESSRPLPTYPRLLATWARLALRAGKRRAARRLAQQAAELGEREPLELIAKTQRRRIRPATKR